MTGLGSPARCQNGSKQCAAECMIEMWNCRSEKPCDKASNALLRSRPSLAFGSLPRWNGKLPSLCYALLR